ncbi:MAG: hypothetical protein QOG05_1932 [Streptosporangiaceae bacterium]|jgi:hypothetical protein|nr:hypothetical protein [Streptosporangiaceae bacterium]
MGGAGSALYGLLAIVLGVGIGWWARRAAGAHSDMKVNKARVPTFRRNRNRAAVIVVLLVVLGLLAINALSGMH